MAGEGRPGPECSVGIMLDEADEDDQETAQMVLDDRLAYTHKFAAEVFTEWTGQRFTRHTIGYHRNDDCRCGYDE